MRFRPRELPAADAAEFVRKGLASIPTQYQVIVDILAPAATVQQVIWDWGRVEKLDEHSSRLIMNVDSFDWPAFALSSVGADFRVIEPTAFRAYLRDVAERYLRST